jgi:transcriptional regulator with XRE-family HTH domain
MTDTPGNGLASHFGKQLRRDRLSHRLSVAELARRMSANPAHLGRVEAGKRPPTVRLAALLDGVFTERNGWYSTFLEDIRTAPEIPATFRSWALIAVEPGIDSATAEIRLKARTERQRRVLHREDPPRVTLLVDEVALWRRVGSAAAMTAQMTRLGQVAEFPHVTVQVMPAIEHPAVSSGYVLADDAVYCEHLAAGGVFTDPVITSKIEALHDSLRAECYRASESLAMIAEAGKAWARGVSPLTLAATAGTA